MLVCCWLSKLWIANIAGCSSWRHFQALSYLFASLGYSMVFLVRLSVCSLLYLEQNKLRHVKMLLTIDKSNIKIQMACFFFGLIDNNGLLHPLTSFRRARVLRPPAKRLTRNWEWSAANVHKSIKISISSWHRM